ncbi:phytoene/squalene synthase family protein [Hoeflea poritis]|uniref:Phytoene/squalene synthase family protein n=1 Tax=Hoeflea poritis TaxID=2993659 RepID=A0ABT4VPR6_9HYPH|nr:phytoene/squalene synthase family protein [Hoeflea poritis]MDA4846689.1 phytoene/squalene synthase family protein [Hoeflea poritis]
MTVEAAQGAAPGDVLQFSEEMIAKGSKSFAAAAKLFAPQTRADAVMLYAWCRHADDVIDGQELGHARAGEGATPDGQLARLATLKRLTEAALDGKATDDPVFEALRKVVSRNRIPHRHPQELLAGFEMDVSQREYRTADDTLDYCYHVAGVVGVMMAMIMGVRDEAVLDRASDLGLAFQLTNIARDIIDDARAGRVYLPADWLDEAGLTEISADRRDQWPALHGLALRLLDQAEPYYDSAYAGLSALPFRSAWAVAAARRVYRDIGSVLRTRGPEAWEKRVSTSKGRKVWLLALSLVDVLATRFKSRQIGQRRTGLYQRP